MGDVLLAGKVTLFWFSIKFLTLPPQAMFSTNRGTVGGFFLAGRNMVWWPVSFL